MNLINTLFYTDSDGSLLVNKPEARKIKEYEVLFKRDKNIDGANKRLACAEIYLIYLLYDIRSTFYNLPADEKMVRSRETAGIPEKWKIDDKWLEAVERYKNDFELTSTGKGYAVAERFYYNYARDVESLQNEVIDNKALLEIILKRIKKRGTDNDLSNITAIKEATAVMLDMVEIQKRIEFHISKFKKLGDTVQELALKFNEEGGASKIPIGGGELGNREE